MKLLILNLPNPPGKNVIRDAAGGFGISVPISRFRRKGSGKPYLNPYIPYSAAVANEYDYEHEILDAQALESSKKEIISYVKKNDPNIIFSMISLPSIYEDLKILAEIKRELPETLTVGCGTVCNVIPKEVLRGNELEFVTSDLFPYVKSLGSLLEHYNKNERKLIPGFTGIYNNEIKKIPLESYQKDYSELVPNYEKMMLNDYGHFYNSEGKKSLIIPIMGSRGCEYPCSYCPYPIGFGKTTIFKDPKLVVDEIEKLSAIGFNYFLFRDQSFTTNKDWSQSVCTEILNRNVDIKWVCEARADETSISQLKMMIRSGCERIHYGVESGDPTQIGIAKPGLFLQKTKETFRIAKELGVWRHAHLLLGLPGETEKTLETTSTFLLDLKPDGVSVNFATPYPGTSLYSVAEKNNWILSKNWNNYTSLDVVMVPPELSPKDLYAAAQKMQENVLIQKTKESTSKGLNLDSLSKLLYSGIQIIAIRNSYRKRFHKSRARQF